MFKFLVITCLIANMSSNVFAAGATKLVDFMLSGSGVAEILGKHGIKGNDAKLVESYIASSLVALGSKKSLTKEELKNVLSKLPVAGPDATVRKELQVLLDKSEGEISKDDVVKAINNIIYLANRHGKSVIITCAECVNENLAKNGFKFTVENIKNSSSIKVLNEVASRAEKDGVATEEAFYRTLKQKAQGNDYLMKQYETLKAKRCFFK